MSADVLNQLESAAKIMLAPPQFITSDQRQAAETVFLNFRKTESPYRMCKHIFETSTVDYVLFETASTLKEALIREWSLLDESEIIELRQYLLDYTTQKPTLAPFVRERILQVIAIMVKRGSVTDFGMERGRILQEVEQLIMGGDLPRQVLGCSIISAMMVEYGNTVKSSDVGLTWETHFKAKKHFEATDLRKILQVCVRTLSQIMELPSPFEPRTLTLLKHLLSISESVFTWGFINSALPKRLIGAFEAAFEAEQFPSLKLTPQWKELILDQNVVNLFFNVHWRIRDNPHLAHHSLSCLAQLASLNGPTIAEKENRTQYFSNYIQSFIKLVSSIEVLDREALGVSNIIRNLMTYYPPTVMVTLQNELLYKFLEQVTRLTCFFAEGAAHEESMHWDDTMFMEACENLLKVWMTILQEAQLFSDVFCKQACAQIFNTYLKCHLCQPDGNRGTGRELDAEEIEETEEDDRVKFKDQLQAIGALGRKVPEHSIPLLAKLLEDRTTTLHSRLEEIHQNSLSIGSSNSLNNLFEDLHWLILISGHVIAMESEGETALIPSEIMQYSIRQAADVDVTLKVLASPHLSLSDIPQAAESSDHVVRLVSAVLRLCEVERKVVQAKLTQLLSPEVGASILWFLRLWSLAYLLPNETYYAEMSMPLLSAFGQHSEGAMWTVNYLLLKIESNLRTFSSEPAITEGSVHLLIGLVDLRDKAGVILKSEGLWRILVLHQGMDSRILPPLAKRGLMKAFVLAGAGLEDSAKREEYWAQILNPLLQRFRILIKNDNFKQNFQDEVVKAGVTNALESFIGVAQGTQVMTVHSVFNLLAPVLSECAYLAGVYSNYQMIIELILELFCDCARSMLCYLTPAESRLFYEACLRTIQMYARSNLGRRSLEAGTEEDAFHDIQLLMELLTTLLSKDFIDLSPAVDSNGVESGVTASDICLYGLSILMPLMTVDLLKFPSLCLQYYKMITFVCELCPEKVMTLSEELLKGILSTIQLGLQSFGQDVNNLCCDFIQALGSHVHSTGRHASFTFLLPFVKILMDMILCRQVNSDVLVNTGRALFVLICCYQDEYRRIVDGWINAQPNLGVKQRLASAFNDLTSQLSLNTDCRQKARFKEAFDKFVIDVHGFLLVK